MDRCTFRGLIIVYATGIIPLSLPSTVSTMVREKQPVAWKEYCAEYWLKELQECMGRCTDRRYLTETLLKTASNTIQSID